MQLAYLTLELRLAGGPMQPKIMRDEIYQTNSFQIELRHIKTPINYLTFTTCSTRFAYTSI